MRRGVVLAVVALGLIWLYSYALVYLIGLATALPVPTWWRATFATHTISTLTWLVLCHTFAVTIAAAPFAFAIARLYRRWWLLVALAATVPLFLIVELPALAQRFPDVPLRLQIVDVLDAVKLTAVLPLLTWAFRSLPSNCRLERRAI